MQIGIGVPKNTEDTQSPATWVRLACFTVGVFTANQGLSSSDGTKPLQSSWPPGARNLTVRHGKSTLDHFQPMDFRSFRSFLVNIY